MKFKSHVVKGKGRGAGLGFPTINLYIPDEIPVSLAEGIYAVWLTEEKKRFMGALYYGTIPTFGDTDHTLEVYLIDAGRVYVGEGTEVEVEMVKFIRPPETFGSPELLILAMERDVEKIRSILK